MDTPILGDGLLVPLEIEHAADLLAAGKDNEVWQYLPSPKPQNKAEMEAWILARQSTPYAPPELQWAIIHEGKAIGTTSFLNLDLRHKRVEIGWTWLGKSWWQTGLNRKVKLTLLSYAFDELKLRKVSLKTDGRNDRSKQAIEALGATKEGVLRQNDILWDGFIRDVHMYSILANEWPEVAKVLSLRQTVS